MNASTNTLLLPTTTGELVPISRLLHTRHSEGVCTYITSGTAMDMDVEMTFPIRPAPNGSTNGQPEPYFTPKNPPHHSQSPPSDLLTIEEFERQFPRQPKLTKKTVVPISSIQSDPTVVHKFNNLCQLHGMLPHFDVPEVGPQSFTAKVQFGEYVVNSTTCFQNKKLAKEDVCRLALPILEELDVQRSRSEKAAERQKSRDEASNRVRSDLLNAENWIGVLMSWTQREHIPFPIYTEYQTESTPYEFACTVTVESLPIPFFGSTDDLYHSKSEAKKAAAREAVLWLRNVGKLSSDDDSQNNPSQLKPTSGNGNGNGGVRELDTLPGQVHALAVSLGLHQPSWQASPCAAPEGTTEVGPFYSWAAVFHPEDVLKDERLRGDVGRVENVYGKKRAKERCCVEVLRVLEEIRGERMLE